jgi:hypothetical protein
MIVVLKSAWVKYGFQFLNLEPEPNMEVGRWNR